MNARNQHAQVKLKDLVLRCYAEKEGDGTWFAMCLPLNLYARGDSFDQARQKLHSVISAYLKDVLVGSEKQYAENLIPRRAPLYFWLRYAFIWCCVQARHHAASVRKFKEFLPLSPAV